MGGDGEASAPLAVEGQSVFFYHSGAKQTPTLRGIDFAVHKGAIYGLLGPSGCGKTTLLGCIVGRLTPKAGCVKVYGRIPGEPGFCIPGRGVGYMPQDLALYPEITIGETLTYFGRLFQMEYARIRERIAFLLKFLDLPDQKSLIRNLSGGQQRRVSFAAALIHKPPLLILDEPTVGVDPLLRQSIWEHLVTLAKEEHMTIIITTHYVEEARRADVVALMRKGRLLAQMNPDMLMRRHNVSNLEDVFLKLCHKDVQANEAFCNNSNSILPKDETSFTDVWIPREAEGKKGKENLESNSSNGGQMDALLSIEPLQNDSIYKTQSYLRRIRETLVRMTALISKGFIQSKRNIGFTAFQIFIPVTQVIIFCLCIGGKPFDLPISIVNMETERDAFGYRFIDALDNKTFQKKHYSNLSDAIHSVKNGESWTAVYIGPQFTECLTDRFLEASEVSNETIDCSEVKLYMDMTNQLIVATIYNDFLMGFQRFASYLLSETFRNPRLADPPVIMAQPVYGRHDTKFNEFMAPGVILGITYIMAVGLTAISIIHEKKSGLLDRAWVAGVNHGEIIFCIMFNLFVIMLVQVALVLLFTFLAFDTPFLGPISWTVICVLIVGVCGMAYGLCISALCDDESASLLIALGSFTANLLLSGTIWPIEGMDHYLRFVSYCLPWTLITNTMRFILSRGWNISEHNIWNGYLASSTWTAIFILCSWLLFKYRK